MWIIKEIEDHGYIVTNIWNVKKQDINKTPPFIIELKPENSNDDINEITSQLQNKILTTTLKTRNPPMH